MIVASNFFDVVVPPVLLGRALTAAEANPESNPHIALLSHGFWESRFAADSAIVGRSITLDGESYSIVRALAPRLRSVAGLGITPQIYVPINRAVMPEMDVADARILRLLGRLKPG